MDLPGETFHRADNPEPNSFLGLMNSLVNAVAPALPSLLTGGSPTQTQTAQTPTPVVVTEPKQPKWMPWAIGGGIVVALVALIALLKK